MYAHFDQRVGLPLIELFLQYGSGNGHVFPTTPDPEHFDASSSPLITFPTFPAPSEGVSHPHMALEHGEEVFVPDLASPDCLN
jgi:hypothetical protein